MRRGMKLFGTVMLFLIVAIGLAATIVPRFLDRLYYRGPITSHFDGARFFNPTGEDTSPIPGGGGRAGFVWRQVTGNDDRPVWPTRVPVNQSRPEPRVAGARMVATWIGHATVLVQTNGLNILTDPIWSETAGPFGLGPRRVAAPGVRLADLPPIDLILLSHNHYDHLDLTTLKRLWDRDKPLVVTALGNDSVIAQAGIESIALDWGQRFQRMAACGPGGSCPTIDVAATRNHHWTSRWGTDRDRALWSSFVVTLPGGNLFFAGDTGLGDGGWPAEAARLGPIRLAVIPIGAFRFTPGQMASASHIGPIEAVAVARGLGATTAIPIHWGTFRLSYEGYRTPPLMLNAALRCARQTGFAPVRIGQAVDVAPYHRPIAAPALSRAALRACVDTPTVRALR